MNGRRPTVTRVESPSRTTRAFASCVTRPSSAIVSGSRPIFRRVRVDLPGGDWQALLESIQGLLDRFGPETEVYPGHGSITTLGRELETNPFLHELRAASQ